MAAARLGYRCHILTPDPNSPAVQVSAAATIGDYDDEAALREFATAADVITFEFENVSASGLDLLAALRPVRPSPGVLRVSQDRVAEKTFLNAAGVATAAWRPVDSPAGLTQAIAELGMPAILKTTRLGYDGRGQRRIRRAEDAAAAWETLRPASADPGIGGRFRLRDQRGGGAWRRRPGGSPSTWWKTGTATTSWI